MSGLHSLFHFSCLKPLNVTIHVTLPDAIPTVKHEKSRASMGLCSTESLFCHQVILNILCFLKFLVIRDIVFFTQLSKIAILSFSINTNYLCKKESTTLIKSYLKNRQKAKERNNLVLGLTQTFQKRRLLLESWSRKEARFYNT